MKESKITIFFLKNVSPKLSICNYKPLVNLSFKSFIYKEKDGIFTKWMILKKVIIK